MRRAPLALVAVFSFGGCSPDEPDPEPEVPDLAYCDAVASWAPDAAAFEREVLEQINEARALGGSCGGDEDLPASEPLSMAPALRCAARKHTLGMIDGDYFAHASPDGETYIERVALAEYAGEPLGESIAGGSPDPTKVVTTWLNHDGNCATLLNPEATELGVGYLPASGVTYEHYWTVVFGR